MATVETVLYHLVLISFRDGAPMEAKFDVWTRYQSLREDCGGYEAGILTFTVKENLDLRKNVHLVEFAIFRDDDALQAFRVHPKHVELTNILREIADWQVGDFLQDVVSPISSEAPMT